MIEGGHRLRPFELLDAPAVAVVAAARVVKHAADPPSLWLRFCIRGAQLLQCPAPASCPQRRDHLWQHTCLEAFVAEPGQQAYWEFNLSPSGHWAVYRLSRYREGLEPDPCVEALPMVVERGPAEVLSLEVRCPLPPALTSAVELAVGLTAVLEDQRGGLSYWALHHPATEPDFHDRRGWTLRL